MSLVAFTPGDTLRSALTRMTQAFAQGGLETPEADARFLLQGVLKLERGDVIRDPSRPVGPLASALHDAVRRRLAHEPVARILGEREFYGRAFEVTPDVLDPRADTETIIDEVLALAHTKGWHQLPIRIADIGVGSGAILVTLLAELPLATGVGTDTSSSALAVSARNAVRHRVAERAQLIETSILNGVGGTFDIIVSNPPYIPAAEIAALDAGVRQYDPNVALDGGADGMDVYRQIAGYVKDLDDPPCVVLEAGAGQSKDIAALFGNELGGSGFWRVTYRNDLGGHVRCVTLERQSSTEAAKTVGSPDDKL